MVGGIGKIIQNSRGGGNDNSDLRERGGGGVLGFNNLWEWEGDHKRRDKLSSEFGVGGGLGIQNWGRGRGGGKDFICFPPPPFHFLEWNNPQELSMKSK